MTPRTVPRTASRKSKPTTKTATTTTTTRPARATRSNPGVPPGRRPLRSAPTSFCTRAPEMQLASGDPRRVDIRRHECFGLGVLMVELCWPEVAAGAMGDVAKLLGATLRPDGVGAAALDADPERIRRRQAAPATRPNQQA